ncbi:hypothetical protein BGZ58_005155 [Dissophora ornata]|nr:hypothetical protein BGZ58_005155 [Dissophora ornata]
MINLTNTTADHTTVTPAIQIDAHEEQKRGRNHDRHPITNEEEPDSAKNSGSRRSSISGFVDRLRSRSRSRSRQSIDGIPEELENKDDMHGKYGDVLRAQAEYMEKLRTEQAKNNITHNVDGIPIPPPVNPPREGRRRSIISAISRATSRSRSRGPSRERAMSSSRSSSRNRAGNNDDSNLKVAEEQENKEYRFSRRKSSEISGPYASTLRSQLDYMEHLREKQESNHITHNVDGILIPPPVNPGEKQPSSTQILGLNKNLI